MVVSRVICLIGLIELMYPMRYFLSVLKQFTIEMFKNKKLSFPGHIYLLEIAAVLGEWLRRQTLVISKSSFNFLLLITSCVTFH